MWLRPLLRLPVICMFSRDNMCVVRGGKRDDEWNRDVSDMRFVAEGALVSNNHIRTTVSTLGKYDNTGCYCGRTGCVVLACAMVSKCRS